ANNLEANGIQINGDASFRSSVDSAETFQVLDSAGLQLFTVDTSADRVIVGSATADGTGVVLVLDTKNTAGDPTGVAGAMYFNSNLNRFRCYSTKWVDCRTQSQATTATQTIANTTTETVSTTNYALDAD